MLIPDINAIHTIVPPLALGGVINRQLPADQMMHIRTRGVSMADKELLDQQKTLTNMTQEPQTRLEKHRELDYNMLRKKFVSIHNYHVPLEGGGSRAVTDFDDFVRVAPPELVSWYIDVVQSGERLAAAEMRNFLPQPVSPSGSQSGETATNGTAAPATPISAASATATT